MKDFLKGRSHRHCYRFFFSFFAPVMERKRLWNQKVVDATTDEDAISLSNEAFALTVMENQWDRWIDIYIKSGGLISSSNNVKIDDLNSDVKTKYTRGGKYSAAGKEESEMDRDLSLRGWTGEGMRRFNANFEMVSEDRRIHPKFFKGGIS